MRALSQHLEEQVFSELRPHGPAVLSLDVGGEDEQFALRGHCGDADYQFPGMEVLARRLSSLGLRRICLDIQLESGQIVETLLIYLYCAPYLHAAAPSEGEYKGWKAIQVARQLRTQAGYSKFCAVLRFDAEDQALHVDYSYCELFLSRMVKAYAEHWKQWKDHRVLFWLAPRVGVAGAGVVLLGLLAAWLHPWLGIAVLVLASTLAIGAAEFMFYTVGSIQYTREHHDKLIKEYYKQMTVLSHFPHSNPNPIMRITRDGEITHENPAVETLLRDLDFLDKGPEAILPEDFHRRVADVLDGQAQASEIEFKCQERVLRYLFVPFKDEQAVIAAGNDITHLKDVERDLREFNQDLEGKVHARTEELYCTQNATILSLASLAEARDPETGAHLQRTSAYVRALAMELRDHPRFRDYLNERVIDELYRSVPLHDIGKVAIPDAILLKPGKLTPEEFEIMKTHAAYGGDALRRAEELLGTNSFLKVAREVAYAHHERWDGSGYPKGLSGDDIPIAARLMTLADKYDALRAERCYKAAWPHEKTRNLILEERGTTFDADIVEAFLALEDEFQEITRRFVDED